MTITSTYDHRVIQGAESGEFLRTVEMLLSGKDGFYEGIFAAFGLTAGPEPTGTGLSPAVQPSSRPAAQPSSTQPSSSEHVAAAIAPAQAHRPRRHLAARLDALRS